MVATKEQEILKAGEVFRLLSVDQNPYFDPSSNIVLITFDDNYVGISINLMLSVARHNPEVSFVCMCPKLKQENMEKLMALKQGLQVRCYHFESPVDTGPLPACAVFRIFCPWLLPEEIGKLLYIDPDVLCTGSLADAFKLDVECIGMCNEICGNVDQLHQETVRLITPTEIYCNAGVVLMNLNNIRRDYSFQQTFEALIEMGKTMRFLDQDFLNIYFRGNITYMNGFHYNFQAYELRKTEFYEQALNNCRLIHFSVGKPWMPTTNLQLIKLYLQHSEYPEMIERCQKAARGRMLYLPKAAWLKLWNKVKSVFGK